MSFPTHRKKLNPKPLTPVYVGLCLQGDRGPGVLGPLRMVRGGGSCQQLGWFRMQRSEFRV